MEALVQSLYLEASGDEKALLAYVKQLVALDTGSKVVPGGKGVTIKRHDGSTVTFVADGQEFTWTRTTSGKYDLGADSQGDMYDLLKDIEGR
jgi:hypothetical protein